MSARSCLFVPAHRADRLPKALASGADAVIVDLEDAVAPGDKDGARAALDAALASRAPAEPGRRTPELWVRVNAADPWCNDDLALCARHAAVQVVMLPKAETVEALDHAHATSGKPLVALIETARGYSARRAIAGHPAVQRLAFGSIDFQVDLGIDGEDEALLAFRSGLVLASRLCERPAPLDGVTVEVGDDARVAADAQRSRRLGFGGKLCIHPSQVAVVNAAFSPSPQEVAWAQRVLAAAQAAGGAAVAVDGKMVDKPVLLRAQALLARHR